MKITRENFPRMHVCGAGSHLHCTNNKPANKFHNYGYAKIYHREKYPLYGTRM